MTKVTCYDVHSKAYVFDSSELVKRNSVYGVHFKDQSVLLTKDKIAKQWEVPGGGVEDGEDELASLRREIQEETGLTISDDLELISTRNEYFFGLYKNIPVDSLRKFYLVKDIVSGDILPNGNDYDTIAAKYVSLKEVEAFSENEMKDYYKKIINEALSLSRKK